jgi:hypothetical protein
VIKNSAQAPWRRPKGPRKNSLSPSFQGIKNQKSKFENAEKPLKFNFI